MSKCSFAGCTQKPIGGVEEIISAGHFQDPTATIPGQRTIWCALHEADLKRTVAGKQTRQLTPREIEEG